MLGRVIIAIVGAGFAVYCVVAAFLTYFEKNPATLHLKNFYLVGYAAVNAVLTPFGISGVVGGLSRKKSLIKAFTRFQWWLATFILIGLNVFNVILSKNGKKDLIRRCQTNFATESNMSARCIAIVEDADRATFIGACSLAGIMIFLGIILVIVGTREYSSISLEEETRKLLEKANFSESDDRDDAVLGRSSSTLQRKPNDVNNKGGDVDADDVVNINYNNGGTFIPDQYDVGRYPRRQPSNATDLARRPTNTTTVNVLQHSSLRRHPTDPSSNPPPHAVIIRNQTDPNYMSPTYTGLVRHPTNSGNVPSKGYNGLARYPTSGSNISASRSNVTRQPTIGNAYVQRNYVGAPQATYPIVPQRSLSTNRYVSPPPPYVISPQQTLISNQNIVPISEVNEYSENINDYDDPYITRMGMH